MPDITISIKIKGRQGTEAWMEDATITVGSQAFSFKRRTEGDPGDTGWLSKSRSWLPASSCEAALIEAARFG